MSKVKVVGKKVQACVSDTEGRPQFLKVPTLLEAGENDLLGRKILDVRYSMPSFTGEVTTEFLGFLLAGQKDGRLQEWLVMTVFYAAEFCLLDGKWVKANYGLYDFQKPLVSDLPAPDQWDLFKPAVLECEIKSVELTQHSLSLGLKKIGETHQLECVDQDERLPVKSGEKVLCESGSQLGEYFILQPEGTYSQW